MKKKDETLKNDVQSLIEEIKDEIEGPWVSPKDEIIVSQIIQSEISSRENSSKLLFYGLIILIIIITIVLS